MPTRTTASQVHSMVHRRTRITRACDQCHHNNRKCIKQVTESRCAACKEFAIPCTFDRPVGQRGPRPGRRRQSHHREGSSSTSAATQTPPASHDRIVELVTQYRTIAYPIFPLFHWPTLMHRVHNREYVTDIDLHATVMAVCGIVHARLPETTNVTLPPTPADAGSYPLSLSRKFHHAALSALEAKDGQGEFENLRTHALLAILGVQYGEIRSHREHLGRYLSLSSLSGLYDESRWPRGLSVIDLEERRRLFWSMYTLEIFSCISFGGNVQQRAAQSCVMYPTEVADDLDLGTGMTSPLAAVQLPGLTWMKGWNFTTDIYRVLEILVDRLRVQRAQQMVPRSSFDIQLRAILPLLDESRVSDLLQLIEDGYERLDPQFKTVRAYTGDPSQDIFGFQAANIAISRQTVRMLLAGLRESSVEKRCAIAGELLDTLSSIPTAYIAAVSAPMLQHLASVGHLLSQVIQTTLSQWSMLQVRHVLVTLADLLAGLEAFLSLSTEISSRLKAHIPVIDARLEAARESARHRQIYHGPPTTAPDMPAPTQGAMVVSPPDETVGSSELDMTFSLAPALQQQLQTDLTSEWPFDFAFDFDAFDMFGSSLPQSG